MDDEHEPEHGGPGTASQALEGEVVTLSELPKPLRVSLRQLKSKGKLCSIKAFVSRGKACGQHALGFQEIA